MCISLFWPWWSTCGILVPWPGIEPGPSAERAQSPNHWTTREVPQYVLFISTHHVVFPVCVSPPDWAPWHLNLLSIFLSPTASPVPGSEQASKKWMTEWYKTDVGKLVELGYSRSIFFIRFDLCSSVGKKKSTCNAGDPGSIPGLGGSPGEGNGNPFQYSCLRNLMDRNLAGYSPWDCKELDMT